MNNLASTYRTAGRLADAVPLYEELLKQYKTELGDNHLTTLSSMIKVADSYLSEGRLGEALPLFEKALRGLKGTLGADHPRTLVSMSSLAQIHIGTGRHREAVPLLEEMFKLYKTKFGIDHPHSLNAMYQLAITLEETKKFDRAAMVWQEYLTVQADKFSNHHLLRANLQVALGRCLLQTGKPALAESHLSECFKVYEKQQPEVWTTFYAKALLGAALSGQKKFAEAELLLIAGYEGMKQRADLIPTVGKVRLVEAEEYLVQLYDAWGRPDQAKAWRNKLESAGVKVLPPSSAP